MALPKRSIILFAVVAAWLLATAFVRPLSVDESQYVAATALVADGNLPYRDFAYLQTPLQPFILAPLQWLFFGHLFLASRVLNAILASATVMVVYATARRTGAAERPALTASVMLVACQSFIWCAGVARNDVLPAVLMTLALLIIVRSRGGWSLFISGALFGLAASAKISYAVPGAAVFLAGLSMPELRRRFLWFGAGLAASALPTLIVAALAPRAALTEAILFPARAPTLFYTEIGSQWRLGPGRFVQLLVTAAVGPALIAAIMLGRRCWRQPDRWIGDPARRILLAAALGGLLSACLNKPFQIFYLLPALPPLFVLAALMFSEWGTQPRWMPHLWGLFMVVGLLPALHWFGRAGADAMPAMGVERTSRKIGAVLRAHHVDGPIATLAPQYIPDSGYKVDPRFAAGPFLYRTRNFLAPGDAAQWHIETRDRAISSHERLPQAIVTSSNAEDSPEMEARLATLAAARAYRPVARFRGFTVWVRG